MSGTYNLFADSRDLSLLDPQFAELGRTLLARCRERGHTLVPFFTLRGPGIQAKLWCQSRTPAQILARQHTMRQDGAPFLASLLLPEYGNRGRHVTNALPGQSWHQWAEALDCFVQNERNEAIWNGTHAGYKVYAEEAMKLGLEPGAYWKTLKDPVHVQWRKAASPAATGLTWPQIDKAMQDKFRR
jgi:peptidoglycan LD-endopeptidase CwlK